MNEQIENLFAQALDEAVPETWTTLDPVQLMRLRDKFAELIVREMLVTCEEHPAWTGRMIGEQIKQHFGVEE
jgi:hypothetical protein